MALMTGCNVDYFGTGGSAHRGEFPDGKPPGENAGGSQGGGNGAGGEGTGSGDQGSGAGGEQPGDGPGSGEDPGANPGPVLPDSFYLLTIEYPQGYDWIADMEKGHVNDCYLVVYKDFSEITRVAVSNAAQVSSDPDRAYLCGGDLYTFYPLEYETVVKKNGREFLTIRAAENINSVLVHKGDFYTLGYGMTGRSVSFRKNGESIIYTKDASIMSGLYLDGDNVGFSYVVHSRPKKYFYCVGEMAFQLQGVGSDWTVYGLQTMFSQPMYVYRDDGYMVCLVHPRLGYWDFSVAPDEGNYYNYDLLRLKSEVVPVEHYRYGNAEDLTVYSARTVYVNDVTYSQSVSYACGDRAVLVYGKRGQGYWVEEISAAGRQQTQIPARFDYAPPGRAVVLIDDEVYAGFSTKTTDGESRVQIGPNSFKALHFNGYIVALGK